MQTVSLSDFLLFTRMPAGIATVCSSPGVPAGSENLAYQALALLKPQLSGGIRLEIQKRIPVAAGLGGGSSDAAVALKGANLLYDLGLGEKELISYAAQIGSDVPFFILGGTVLAQGRGEIVSRLPAFPPLWLVLVKPSFEVPTEEVYVRFQPVKSRRRTPLLLRALTQRDHAEVVAALGNDLEEVTIASYPEVRVWKQRLKALGAEKVLMTGSGPTVFGVFPDEREAREAARCLFRESEQVIVCKTVSEAEIAHPCLCRQENRKKPGIDA